MLTAERHTFSILALASLVACVGPLDDDSTDYSNATPHAALRLAVIGPRGVPIPFDATASSDPDADPLTYYFDAGDGTPTVHSGQGRIEHTYDSVGIKTVYLRVVDLDGAEAAAAQDITIIDDFPNPPDYCSDATDCVVGDECADGVCYSNGGGLD